MSNQFSEEYYERLKEQFADDHPELIEDSDEFIEQFTQYLKENDPKNEPSLSAYERNRSLAN